MKFIFITNNPEIAAHAIGCGVDWVMVDLERYGKQARQGHLDTVKSAHGVEDVRALRPLVPEGSLLVRTDPVNKGSAAQVEEVIESGADALMLPFFNKPQEVEAFSRIVAGRVPITLLVETPGACETIAECCAVDGIERVHVGLNDLSLLTGHKFMFELLTDGIIDRVAERLTLLGMPFGIGGVARVGEGLLPAEDILIEHARLGSDAAILSRTFHRRAESMEEIEADMNFADEVQKLRTAFLKALSLSEDRLAIEHDRIEQQISRIAADMLLPSKA